MQNKATTSKLKPSDEYKLRPSTTTRHQSSLNSLSGDIVDNSSPTSTTNDLPNAELTSLICDRDQEDSVQLEETNTRTTNITMESVQINDETFMEEMNKVTDSLPTVEDQELFPGLENPDESLLHVAAMQHPNNSISPVSEYSHHSQTSPPPPYPGMNSESITGMSEMIDLDIPQNQQIEKRPTSSSTVGSMSPSCSNTNNYVQLEPRQQQQQQMMEHHRQQVMAQQQQEQIFYQMQAQQYMQHGYGYEQGPQQVSTLRMHQHLPQMQTMQPMMQQLPRQMPVQQYRNDYQQYPSYQQQPFGMGSPHQQPMTNQQQHHQLVEQQQQHQQHLAEQRRKAQKLSQSHQVSGAKKRARTAYTSHQLMELEREFAEGKYVCRTKRSSIAQELVISERQVKIWFQNRRMKEKKDMQKRNQVLTQSPGFETSEASSSGISSAASSPISSSSTASISPKSEAVTIDSPLKTKISMKKENQSIVNRLLAHSPQNFLRASLVASSAVSSTSGLPLAELPVAFEPETTTMPVDNISSYYSSFLPENSAWTQGSTQGSHVTRMLQELHKEREAVKVLKSVKEEPELQDIDDLNPTIGSWY